MDAYISMYQKTKCFYWLNPSFPIFAAQVPSSMHFAQLFVPKYMTFTCAKCVFTSLYNP